MKKLFLSICFMSAILISTQAFADAIEINNDAELRQRQNAAPNLTYEDPRIPKGNDYNEVKNFIIDRLQNDNVIVDTYDANDENNTGSMNVQHSEDYIKQINDSKKSTFEKIYENALNRSTAQDEQQHLDLLKNQQELSQKRDQQQQEWQGESPDFPVISIELPPSYNKVLVPAREHIPYMFSDIEILPTGQIKITETIMVVANNQKLKNGLSRALPRYATSRTGIQNNINVKLISVSVNDLEIPHKLQTSGTKTLIIPSDTYLLAPGVYTYKFNYIIDRSIWEYDNFDELYWNVTGGTWNMVVTRIGAIVSLPGNNKALGKTALRGYPGYLYDDVAIIQGSNNTVGFISTSPLFIGEGLHIIISLPKDDFITPDFNQKISYFFDDYGDIIICLFALIAIWGSYFLSWKFMQKNNNRQKRNFHRNAPMLRLLAKGVFDKISFGAFLLELYKKNIVDIEENDNTILLVKRTDNFSHLSRKEKKALHIIFPNKESTFKFTPENSSRVQQFYNLIEKDTHQKFKLNNLKLNLSYVFFSLSMLLMAEVGVAMLSLDAPQTFSILLACSLAFACYILFFKLKSKNKFIRYLAKTLSLIIIIFNILIIGFYTKLTVGFLILAMVYTIFAYTKIFSRRNGLIKENIHDAVTYADYLIKNVNTISVGRYFLNQQANILAAEVAKFYPNNPNIANYYRLDSINKLLSQI